MTINKKWNAKVLPLVNIIFKKYRHKDEHFNPKKFLEEVDEEMSKIVLALPTKYDHVEIF